MLGQGGLTGLRLLVRIGAARFKDGNGQAVEQGPWKRTIAE